MKKLLCWAIFASATASITNMAQEADQNNEDKKFEKNKRPVNKLAKEASPYLRQHKHNPVNWYPWGKEAFDKAKKENKPILLSIGYSTCHWCHVMERESFEDKQIAAYLNKHYVAIKLDREERPDVDKVYMTSYAVMTGEGGGWPLNVFLTPDLKMFYGGTYFPPRDREGRTGFESVIKQLNTVWTEKNGEVLKSAEKLTQHMKKAMKERKAGDIVVEKTVLTKAAAQMILTGDFENGGWGDRNKFPMPSHLSFLLRAWRTTGDVKTLEFVKLTADKMAQGGVYDHLGGGFHRYSIDKKWLVPHFEKMLYDQAQLLDLYLDLWLITTEDRYKKVAQGIADYVISDLQAKGNGGYFCAQDAQSEGKEGKYFCWTLAELKTLLTAHELAQVVAYYAITEKGNFYDHSDPNALKNQNILSLGHVTTEKIDDKLLNSAIRKMKATRAKRIPPMTDRKILSSWNGLMIGAMYRASVVLDNPAYKTSAVGAYNFIKKTMWNSEKKTLAHRYFDHAYIGGAGAEIDTSTQAESYLLMMQAARRMYELSLDPDSLAWATELADASQKLFFDTEKGGFYEAAEVKDVVVRLKGDFDGAIPTSSSAAVIEYLKLAALTDQKKYREIALKTLQFYQTELSQYPTSLTNMLSGLDYYHAKKQRLVIVTENQDDASTAISKLNKKWLPNLTLMSNKGNVDPFNKTLTSIDNKTTFYLCEGKTCKPPVTEIEGILKGIGK